MKALNTFKCISLDKTIVLKHRPTFKQLHNMISTNCAWADRLSVVTQPRDISAAAWPAAALSCTIIRRTVSRNSWERKSKLQRTLAKIGSIFFAIWEWKANHWSLTWIISYYDTLRIDLGVAGTFKLYVVRWWCQQKTFSVWYSERGGYSSRHHRPALESGWISSVWHI